MVQVIEMTDKEKLKMYMKCSKKELAKMLIESNRIVFSRALEVSTVDGVTFATIEGNTTVTRRNYPNTLTNT